jgi:hypothetical protein
MLSTLSYIHAQRIEVKSKNTIRIIQRAEAAHRILKVFSKLGQKWERKPTILLGWKDSL